MMTVRAVVQTVETGGMVMMRTEEGWGKEGGRIRREGKGDGGNRWNRV